MQYMCRDTSMLFPSRQYEHTSEKLHRRLPPYSIGFPFLKNLIVGYPLTSNCWASSLSSVASTLPSLISDSSSARVVAAVAYCGASALQCPHQGASSRWDQKYGQSISNTVSGYMTLVPMRDTCAYLLIKK